MSRFPYDESFEPPTGDVQDVVLYRAAIEVAGLERILLVPGLGTETIIGRDLLSALDVHLDGPGGAVTVTRGP